MKFTNQAPKRHANPKPEPIVKKRNHPNIVAIFEKLYKIQIKSRDAVSIEEQRHYGIHVTGDKVIDNSLLLQMQYSYVTINDMVEYYRDGISFHLTNEEDSKIIYEAVTAHTGEWRMALKYAYNMGDSPVEDLILMENFAASVYSHAKFEYEKRPAFNAASGTLAAFLYSKNSLPGVMFLNDVRQSASANNTDDERDVHKFKHEPNIDVFQNALMQNLGNQRQ